jgi:hypothetical protein
MSPLVAEIFVPIPGTGARVNLVGVILAASALVLLALVFAAVVAMVVANCRRDDER